MSTHGPRTKETTKKLTTQTSPKMKKKKCSTQGPRTKKVTKKTKNSTPKISNKFEKKNVRHKAPERRKKQRKERKNSTLKTRKNAAPQEQEKE